MKFIVYLSLFFIGGFLNASEMNRDFDKVEQILDSQEQNVEVADSQKNICVVCHKYFLNLGDLMRHRVVHLGKRQFPCEFEACDKIFTRLENLMRHQLTHTEKKPYKCGVEGCVKKFTDASNLKRHQLVHTKKKPYKCGVKDCEKTFNQKSNMEIHQKKHVGELSTETVIEDLLQDDLAFECTDTMSILPFEDFKEHLLEELFGE